MFAKKRPKGKIQLIPVKAFHKQDNDYLNNQGTKDKHPRHHIFFERFSIKKNHEGNDSQ